MIDSVQLPGQLLSPISSIVAALQDGSDRRSLMPSSTNTSTAQECVLRESADGEGAIQ
jgi:hypothetical protein